MKLEPTSECLVFTRYDRSTKSYQLWNPRAQKFTISTDVVFEETIFPFHTQTPKSVQPAQPNLLRELASNPKEYVDVTLPESDNEDNNTPLNNPPVSLSIQPDASPQQQTANLPEQPPVTQAQEPWRSTRLTQGLIPQIQIQIESDCNAGWGLGFQLSGQTQWMPS